jgi:hypothetical protein
MKLYVSIQVQFVDNQTQSTELEFGDMPDGATLADCPQAPIWNAVKSFSGAGAIKSFAVSLLASSTAE